MKAEVNREVLVKKLGVLSSIRGNAKALPVVECVKLEFGKRLTITSLSPSIDIGVQTSMEYEGECEGAVVINPDVLLATLSNVKIETVTLEVKDKQFLFYFAGTRKKYKTSIDFESDDFPRLNYPQTKCVSVSSETFSKAVNNASQVADKNDVRQFMQGFHIKTSEGKLHVNGVTGVVMCIQTVIADVEVQIPKYVIVSKDTYSAIKLMGASPLMDIYYDENSPWIGFDNGEFFVTTRFIDGKVPNVEGVIQGFASNSKISFDKIEMSNAIKRLMSFANRKYKGLLVKVSDDAIILEARDVDWGREAIEDVLVEENKNFEHDFGVNMEYLRYALSSLSGKVISISQSNPEKTMIITDELNNSQSVHEWYLSPVLISAL
jgi:DNA polymerase III sliding clamp (beta) subunit (PCNA family)